MSDSDNKILIGGLNIRNWDLLIDAVSKKRVVPIIGDEFFFVESEDGHIPINKYILRKLASSFGLDDNNLDFTFISDYLDEVNYRNRRNRAFIGQTDIYFEIDNILRNTRIKCDDSIVDFLSVNQFPLVLTTSYVIGLESEMQALFGDVIVKSYDKSSRSDIPTFWQSQKPLLYYLFGRTNRIKKSFMVTEDDLLEYLHLWHNIETRPIRFSEYLKDKFLLVLGCNYPNWLFRFFWHSIKNFSLVPNSFEMQGIVAMESLESDRELIKFLSRVQTQAYQDSKFFIGEFLKKWSNRVPSKASFISEKEGNVDIFISYAKEDAATVKNITQKLRDLGADVWLDEAKLGWSDLFESIIEDKITKAKRFVPILSQVTSRPGRRFFRREWAIAIREMDFRYGMPYFAPIVIDDSNINSELIPKQFKDAHIISSFDKEFESEMKALIRSFRK